MNVSVVVPVFNSEKTIRQCLESLKSQSFTGKMEIIIVDDGSTDSTKEAVKEFNEIKLIEQRHKGPAAARNLGAKNAKGEIIVFTDSDCVADSKMVEKLINPFQYREIAGVQGSYKTKQKELMAKFIQLEIEERYQIMKKSNFIDFIGTYCCAYRKDVFRKEQGFDENFPLASGEDTEFSFKLSKKGYKLVFQPEAFCYHSHLTSFWEYLRIKFFRAYYRVKLYHRHKQKMIKDSYTPQHLKLQVGLFYSFFAGMIAYLLIPSSQFFLLASVSLLGAIIALSLPSAYFMLKKDFVVSLASPFILISRTAIFSLGLVCGLLGLKK